MARRSRPLVCPRSSPLRRLRSATAPIDTGDRARSPAATRRLPLLLALRPDGSELARWARAHGAAADWKWLLRRAAQHKVAPLLAERLAACDLDRAVLRHLALIRMEAARRAEAAGRTLARLSDALAAAGVPFFVVKGSVLAHQIYGEPRRRRFADVDVMVHRADVERAEQTLRALGYRPGGFEAIVAARPRTPAERLLARQLTRRFEARHLGAFTWRAPRGDELLPVDLHWQLSPDRLPRDEDRLWQQTVPLTVAGTRVLTLGPAATVLHLAAHATTCLLNGFRLLHLTDVGWAVHHFADHGAAIWALADRWRLTSHLAMVFALIEERLGIEVPIARNGPRRRAAAPPLVSEAMLVDVPDLAALPLYRRAGPELAWAIGMRCIRRSVRISAAAAIARVRFSLSRRRWRRVA